MLTISPEKICFVIVKAREYDVKVAPSERTPGSNPTDDQDAGILEDRPDDPTYEELRGALDSLNDDELHDLIALSWLGRGDYTDKQWDEALAQARETPAGRAPDYLLGTPLLADFLEEGLGQMGLSCEDFEKGRL